MSEILGVLALVGGVLLAIFGYRRGAASERERSRKFAEEAERRGREQAAKEAGEAMRRAARERDEALTRPASGVVGDAMRRGR